MNIFYCCTTIYYLLLGNSILHENLCKKALTIWIYHSFFIGQKWSRLRYGDFLVALECDDNFNDKINHPLQIIVCKDCSDIIAKMNLKIKNTIDGDEEHCFNSEYECCITSTIFLQKRFIPIKVSDMNLINFDIRLTGPEYLLL